MAQYPISKSDEAFLRQLRITPDITPDPEPNPYRGYGYVYISAAAARAIIKRYGELNWANFVAYRTDKQDGESR